MPGSAVHPSAGASGLAAFLRSNENQVFDLWEREARKLLETRDLTRPELTDFLPPLLRQVADFIDQTLAGRVAELSAETGAQHALDRLEEGFDLGEVVAELSLLRECILKLWHDAVGPSEQTWFEDLALHRCVDRAIGITIDHYMVSRDRILQALDRVSSTALESDSLEDLLEEVISVFQKEVPTVDTAAILLREGDELRLQAASGLERELATVFTTRIGEGFAGTIAATGRPLHLRGAANDPLVRSEIIHDKGVDGLYGVPLLHAGEVVGVANMGSTTTSAFSEQDRILFDAMAQRVAAAISQRLLRDEVESRVRELETALREAEAARELRDSLLEQLREREERLRLVVDATGIGAFDFDPRTGRLEWSAHAKIHFGVPPDAEAAYETFRQALHPEDRDRVEGLVEDALRPGSRGEFKAEYRVIGLQDHEERWLAARGRVTFDEQGHAQRFVGFTFDITERKRSDERLRESDRRKDEFLAILGHELRNPLSAIVGATDLLGQAASDHDLVERATGVLERQSTIMTRLVDGLLEISRIGRGKIELEREPLDLIALVEDVAQDRLPRVQARGLELRIHTTSDPVWVIGDRVRLMQVLHNLLGNAIKFTSSPGHIDLHVRRRGSSAVISVQDTGVGIPPERLARIFDPFEQVPEDISKTSGGLGLGLAVAKGLVDLHQGRIEVHSSGPGTGTEFEIRLPLAAIQREAPRSRLPDRARVPSRRILIVEDNPDAAQMLHDLLELWGHEAATVDNAPAALDTLRRAPTDMVLCDLGLPGMSGYDLAREVRRDPALHDIFIVALTGHGQPEDRGRTAEAGFDEHLLKPVDAGTLHDVLLRLGRERPGDRS